MGALHCRRRPLLRRGAARNKSIPLTSGRPISNRARSIGRHRRHHDLWVLLLEVPAESVLLRRREGLPRLFSSGRLYPNLLASRLLLMLQTMMPTGRHPVHWGAGVAKIAGTARRWIWIPATVRLMEQMWPMSKVLQTTSMAGILRLGPLFLRERQCLPENQRPRIPAWGLATSRTLPPLRPTKKVSLISVTSKRPSRSNRKRRGSRRSRPARRNSHSLNHRSRRWLRQRSRSHLGSSTWQ